MMAQNNAEVDNIKVVDPEMKMEYVNDEVEMDNRKAVEYEMNLEST